MGKRWPPGPRWPTEGRGDGDGASAVLGLRPRPPGWSGLPLGGNRNCTWGEQSLGPCLLTKLGCCRTDQERGPRLDCSVAVQCQEHRRPWMCGLDCHKFMHRVVPPHCPSSQPPFLGVLVKSSVRILKHLQL